MAKAAKFYDKKLDSFIDKYIPDEYDRRIIRILSHDGRASYTEIADMIGVTPATIRNRIKNLQEQGIIKNFKPLLDRQLFNLDVSAMLFISLQSSKLTEGIVSELKEMPEIAKISIMASDPNIVCNLFSENMGTFSLLLAKITQLEGVKDIKTNFVLKSISSGSLIQ